MNFIAIILTLGQIIFPDGSVQTTAYQNPEVVILGDSTVMCWTCGYGPDTGYVYNKHENGGTAANVVTFIDWASENGNFLWVNAGIHDANKGTPLDVYADNVREIIMSARRKNMQVVWCTTLELQIVDVSPYNEVATSIMYELNVPVYDINRLDIEISFDNYHMTPKSTAHVGSKIRDWIEENV